MYAPWYYFCSPPLCMPGFPQPFYPTPYASLITSQVYLREPQVLPASFQTATRMSQESERAVKEEEEMNKQESSGKSSRFKYPKKNVQSNVVNQVISYITTRAKSQKIVAKILVGREKVEAFYEILKQAKKKNRRYMGRSVLQSLLEIDEDHPVHILHKKLKPRTSLKLGQIRKTLIRLTNYFLRNLIVPTLLTSAKLDKATLQQHLLRAREILSYVNNKPYPALP